jgi:hypothetical protein
MSDVLVLLLAAVVLLAGSLAVALISDWLTDGDR